MKKIFTGLVFLLLVGMFLLTGCGSNETITKITHTSNSQATTSTTTQQTTTQEVSFEDIQLDESTIDQIKSDLLGQRVKLSSNFKKGKIGDYGAFGLGINNLLNRDANFKIYVEFVSATKTLSYGEETITVRADDDLMNKWFEYKQDVFLRKNDMVVIPLKYIIMDKLNSNEEIPPGRYKYTIEVYEVEENGHEDLYQIGNLYIDFLIVE